MENLYRYLVIFFFVILLIVTNTGMNFNFNIEVPPSNKDTIYNNKEFKAATRFVEQDDGTKEVQVVRLRKETPEEKREKMNLLQSNRNYSKFYWDNSFRPKA